MDYSVSFPFSLNENSHEIALSSENEAIKESVYIILMTKKGERFMHPDFGCDLNRFVFELIDSSVIGLIRQEIVSALEKWEDGIDSIEVNVDALNSIGEITLDVSYRIIKSGVSETLRVVKKC